jgi:hypothetical protein
MVLYHRIADAESAQVRRRIMALGLKDRIDFQNVDTMSGAKEAVLELLGELRVPVLRHESGVAVGSNEIEKFLNLLPP